MNKNIELILKEKEEKIRELKNREEEITKKKIDIFKTYIQKIRPTLQLIKDNKLNFRDSENKFFSESGPIIGHDENNLYVYDLDYVYDRNYIYVKKINKHNHEEEDISEYNFFSRCNFEEVMNGLEYAERIPDIVLQDLSNRIEKDEVVLNKYKSKI